MRRNWLLVVLAVIGCLLFGDPSAAKSEKVWTTSILEGPSGWTGSFGNDVSDSGYIAGGYFDADYEMHAAYWYKGKLHDLEDEIGLPEGTDRSFVNSVNSNGLMGGGSFLVGGTDRLATLWDVAKGTVTSLHPSGSDYVSSSIFTVNASGDAVGWVVLEDGSQVAWVWPKGDSTGKALPGISEYESTRANSINSSGMIVGQGQIGTWWGIPSWVPVVWVKNGKSYDTFDLSDEYDPDDYPIARAYDVSETGEVVGRRWDTALYTSAWSWTASEGLSILDDNGTGDASAWRVTNKDVAGGIGFGPLGDSEYDWIADDAALWNNGVLEVVAESVSFGGVTYDYVEAGSVNRSGLVVGFGFAFPSDPPYLPIGWSAEKK